MNPLTNTHAVLLWLLLFSPIAVWIGGQDYADRYERFYQDTSIAQRMLSQKTVQHEAVLATLAALSHAPIPERLLPSLQPSMPQLLGLGYLRDGAWMGSLASPPNLAATVEQARQSNHPVRLPLDEARYWLVAPSGWSLLLDARQLIAESDFPPSLAMLTLDMGNGPLTLLTRQPGTRSPGWTSGTSATRPSIPPPPRVAAPSSYLFDQAERYRHLWLTQTVFSEEALELKRQEHAALVEAILARDATRVSAMMRTHLMTPVPIIAEIMKAEGMGNPSH